MGSGAMGLSAAFHAAKAGHTVEVLEVAPEPGGMAAHFDMAGLSIERFYHFVCKSDAPTMALLEELGIGDQLKWRTTSMGIFTGNRMHDWGTPFALLKFPEISLLSRLRYGLFAFLSVRRERWDAIETEAAHTWITRWCGTEVFERLWKPLFALKFYQYADNVSAAWIWTRIKRIGRSRKSFMEEELGYIEGGSQTLVNALCSSIVKSGGKVRTRCGAQKVIVEDGQVKGVMTPEGFVRADAVICTVPTPLVTAMIPDLPEDWKARYESIVNMGICCLVFKLKRSVSPHFWVNISEPDISTPGIIEFSQLRPVGGDTVVYVPYYMPNDNIKFTWTDEELLNESFGYLQRLNPQLTREDIIAQHVARLRHAQPVCEPGFAAKIPPIQTPIRGLQVADTCFYYPEDRGISESVRIGRQMAKHLSTVELPLPDVKRV
ncbi:NAD(P)/FAD-dependent oxidoreductase [Tunturiibacter gelidoferens]|uniref:NAD(P)/FAD-dependent oxidoreductase n=1 Tax=Tunturiibacter gelidiferens TaxID=3069689 RepID=UPI00359C5BA2